MEISTSDLDRMTDLTSAFDWASTPLGAAETWPQSLKTAVDMMLASGHAMCLAWGAERTLLYNDGYVPMLGQRHPGALGLPLREAWPDVWEEIAPLVSQVFAGKTVRFDEMPLMTTRHGYSEQSWWTFSYSPVRDEAGTVAGLLNVTVDTTPKVRAERALQESEERHRLLVGSWAQAIWETDAEGAAVADSPSWRAYTGQTLDEWLGYGWLDAIHPDDRAHAEQQWREAMAARSVVDAEFRLCAPDGGCRWTNVRAIPLLNAVGVVEKWAGININIDARKRAEAALLESEEKYRAIFDSIDEGLAVVEMIYDDRGEIVDMIFRKVNAAYERQGGIFNVVGRSIHEALPGVEDVWLERYKEVARTGRPIRVEDYQQDVDRWFDVYFTRLDNDGHFVAIVFNDISSRKRAEAELRENEKRQAFLLKLSDAVRPLARPADIQGETTRVLREQLRAGWCYYVDWDLDRKIGLVLRDSAREELSSLAGAHDVSDAPEFVELLAGGAVLTVRDYAGYEHLPTRIRQNFAALGFRSMMMAPLVKEGRLIATLIVGDTEVRDWSTRETSLLVEVAERTWTAIERARAEAALSDSEKLRRFALDSGRMGAWSWDTARDQIRGDAVFMEVYGFPPSDEAFPLSRFTARMNPEAAAACEAVAARTLMPEEEFEGDLALAADSTTGQWVRWRGRAGRDTPSAIHGVSFDISEQKLAEKRRLDSEERQAFLLKLSDAFRADPDEDAVGRACVEALAGHMGVERCYVARFADEQVIIGPEHHAADLPPIAGVHRYADYPESMREVYKHAVVLPDVAEDPRLSETDKSSLCAIKIGAAIVAPIFRGQGNLIWVLAVAMAEPRDWTCDDVRLVQEVGERAWAAMERARAEGALRESEQALGFDLANAERLRSLSERLVSEENLQAIYDEILSATVAITQADAGTVQIYDPATESLELIVSQNFSRKITDYFHRVDASSGTACGVALKTGGRAFVDFSDEVADPGFQLLTGEGIQSAVAVPLLSRTGVPLGMLNAHWRQARHRLDERELRFLDLLARQAADLIEQRRSQSALRESEERFRQFSDASTNVLWIRDAETLKMTFASPAFDAIYGIPGPDRGGDGRLRTWARLIEPESRKAVLANFRRVRAGERVEHEFRIRRASDGALRWVHNTDFPLRDGAGKVRWIAGLGADITDAKEATDRQGVLIAELQHRTRNLIAVVRSLSDRTLGNASSLDDFGKRFRLRLAALSRVQGLLSHLAAGERVAFDELLRAELTAHGAIDGIARKVTLDGPAGVWLRSGTVQTLALGLHELATNAVKYGALAAPEGHLTVRWHVKPGSGDHPPCLHVDWRESGVVMPEVGAPSRGGGYGRELIERALPYQLKAKTSYELGADGVRCTIAVPVSRGGGVIGGVSSLE